MKFKHLGISALALGLVVSGGVTISAFASANSEENPNEAKAILKSNADELPEGTIYMDEIKGDPNSGAEIYEFNGTDELPEGSFYMNEITGSKDAPGVEFYDLNGTDEVLEGVIQMDEVKLEETSAAEHYEFNGTDELPEGTFYKAEVQGNEE